MFKHKKGEVLSRNFKSVSHSVSQSVSDLVEYWGAYAPKNIGNLQWGLKLLCLIVKDILESLGTVWTLWYVFDRFTIENLRDLQKML